MDRDLEINRSAWDSWADLHVNSEFYGVDAFCDGELSIPEFDRAALGDVSGLRLLHLQCHFGLDTLSWERLGAEATGVDFSPRAIFHARRLAARCGLKATFEEANVYDVPQVIAGRFDRVVATAGVLPWLPDIVCWAKVVASMLKPGGRFYLREFHPVSQVFSPEGGSAESPRIGYPYFPTGEAVRETASGTYAVQDSGLTTTTCEWCHPVSAVVQALIDTGVSITGMQEFPFTTYRAVPFLEQRPDGLWHWPMPFQPFPLMYSLHAEKHTDHNRPER